MESPARYLTVILFTDIVGSVELKNRLGTDAYSRLLARHRELFQAALGIATGGTIVQHTGDGFLAEFQTASQAVSAALAFQQLLGREPWGKLPLRVRVGIHQGEVLVEGAHEPGQRQLVGLAVDLSARVMGLAMGGQILLTRSVFDDARQYVRRHPEVGSRIPPPPLRWVAHGRYLFKGMDSDESLEVCEVGAEGLAPLVVPPDGEKARRAVAADEEETLGWRPAVGLEIPGRVGWIVERKLGEGGFGEVWLASHNRLRERHVFKFCFDAERLRSFKREVTLFRLLRDALGARKDFLPLYGIELSSPPYYIESEFVATGNLADWARSQGGIEKVPLATRLRLVAGTARAVAAAHSVGIIHKDIKPTNILIDLSAGGEPLPRLCDFGIGVLADRTRLRQLDITEIGFTQTLLAANDSSRTGTRIYSAPEYLMDKPATIQGDIYAIGVTLYQMVVGDLGRPLASGWERDVADELLREDIATCVDKDPAKRFPNAEALAQSLEQLEPRRQLRRHEVESRRRALARRRAMRLAVAGGGVLLLVAALCAVGYFRERELHSQALDLAQRESQAHQQALRAEKAAQEQRDVALDTLKKLVFEIQDKLEARVGMHALRESLLKVAVGGLEQVQASLGAADSGASRPTAYALTRLSKLFQATGRTDEALAPLQKAQAMLLRLADQAGDDPHARQDLVMIQDELTRIHLGLGHSREALECAGEELRIAEGVRGDAAISRRCLVVACGTLGDINLQMGRPAAALEYYRRGQGLLESAAASQGTDPADRRNLSSFWSRTGDAYAEMGDVRQAREFYAKDLEASEELARDPNDVVAQRNLAISYSRLSDVDLTSGQTQGAIDAQLKSLAIFQAIAQAQPNDTGSQDDVAISLGRMGTLQLKLGRQSTALEAYRKALAIRQDLSAKEPANARALRNLSTACLDMGFVCLRLGQSPQALPYYEQAMGLRQSLADGDPNNPQAQRDLSISLNDLGEAYQAIGRGKEALERFEKSLAIRQALSDASPDSATARRDLAIAHNRIGEMHLELGDAQAALGAYQKALAIEEELAAANPASAEARNDLAIIHFRLGALYLGLKRPAQAEGAYAKAVEICESLAGDSQDAESQHNLVVAYNKLGDLKLTTGQLPAAVECYKKSLAVSKVMAANRDNAEAQRDLSIAYAKLARARLAERSPEAALEFFRQALAMDESMAKAAPDSPQSQRDLIASLANVALTASQLDRHAEAADQYRRALDVLGRLERAGQLAEDQKDWPQRLREQLQQETRLARTRPSTLPTSSPAPTGPEALRPAGAMSG